MGLAMTGRSGVAVCTARHSTGTDGIFNDTEIINSDEPRREVGKRGLNVERKRETREGKEEDRTGIRCDSDGPSIEYISALGGTWAKRGAAGEPHAPRFVGCCWNTHQRTRSSQCVGLIVVLRTNRHRRGPSVIHLTAHASSRVNGSPGKSHTPLLLFQKKDLQLVQGRLRTLINVFRVYARSILELCLPLGAALSVFHSSRSYLYW